MIIHAPIGLALTGVLYFNQDCFEDRETICQNVCKRIRNVLRIFGHKLTYTCCSTNTTLQLLFI